MKRKEEENRETFISVRCIAWILTRSLFRSVPKVLRRADKTVRIGSATIRKGGCYREKREAPAGQGTWTRK